MTALAPTSLMINTKNLVRMVMDGPALKVTMSNRSPILFPLRRLRRIHILGFPDSGMDALLTCAEQQIPIAFFHHNGRLRCRLQPAMETTGTIDHWFEHVDFDADVKQLYQDWIVHQELYLMSQLGINAGAFQSRRKLVNDTLRRFCRKQLGQENFNTALDWLDGLLSFHLNQIVSEFGFNQQRGRERLIEDMKPIFDLWLLYALADYIEGKHAFAVSAEKMMSFYQHQSQDLEYYSKRMLTQLVNRLQTVI